MPPAVKTPQTFTTPPPSWKGLRGGAHLKGGAAHSAALNSISNDYRATTSTTSNEAHIQQITVNTQAADAHGIARTIDGALAQNLFSTHANSGPN